MITVNYVLRKCTEGYKFTKSREKINHLMYMDDIKVFAKKKKKKNLETLVQTIRIYSQDIVTEFGMLIMKSGKRQKAEVKKV